jgi:hypothetical protein
VLRQIDLIVEKLNGCLRHLLSVVKSISPMDSNGMVHGLRPGRAKIIADFDGIQDTLVVDAYTKEGAPAGYRRLVDDRKP